MTDSTVAQELARRAANSTPAALTRRLRGVSDRTITWAFIAPTVLLLLAINIFPLIWTIQLSFTNFKANRASRGIDWVGLENYRSVLTDPDIWHSMQVTAH